MLFGGARALPGPDPMMQMQMAKSELRHIFPSLAVERNGDLAELQCILVGAFFGRDQRRHIVRASISPVEAQRSSSMTISAAQIAASKVVFRGGDMLERRTAQHDILVL